MQDHGKKILQNWASKPYDNLVSYTTCKETALLQDIFQNAFLNLTIARIKHLLKNKKLNRVIDLACATGEWTIKYLGFSSQVVGIDISKNFLEIAKRNSLATPFHDNLFLKHMNIVDYNDFKDADLICLGACPMYIDNPSFEKLLGTISQSMARDGYLYVRASVTNPFRKSYVNSQGHYRNSCYYEDCLKKNGFSILDRNYSSTIVIHGFIVEALKLNRKGMISKLIEKTIHFCLIIKLTLFGRLNYMNWILKKDEKS